MPEEIDFIVNGRPLRLSRHRIEELMKGVPAEPIRRHVVLIRGIEYPVKQVFELATGLDRLDFTSATARRHLAKLGFQLSRVGN